MLILNAMTNLQYITDAEPGYTRTRKGRGFAYYFGGILVKDKQKLKRFKALVIPPHLGKSVDL